MSIFVAEFIGTAILILLGNGVVATELLEATKGRGTGWVLITIGWAVAVFVAVFIVAPFSGAHINPAVTIGLTIAGKIELTQIPVYLSAQFLGAAFGSFLVWVHYRPHFALTEDPELILAVHSTGPAIRSTVDNLISEIIGTFVLVLAVFYISGATVGDAPASLGALDALPVALVVLAIGMSLGSTTGYAINPARDLGPRIMHAILPIKNKGGSDWEYAWIPVVGPVIGSALAAGVFLLIGG